MNDPDSNSSRDTHLGFRMTVIVVGLALLAVFYMLGSVAMKQSDTMESLETQKSLSEDAQSAPARE